MAGLVVPSRVHPGRHAGVQISPIDTHDCASLLELGLCRLEGLIGDVDLLFQCIQLLILKYLPPLPFRDLVAGLSRFPVRWQLFVFGRSRDGRPRVAWSNRTAREQNQCPAEQRSRHGPTRALRSKRVSRPHFAPPGEVAPLAARRTLCPDTIESGGFTTSDSSPFRPVSTSTSLPKSRPSVSGISEIFPSFTDATRKPSERNNRVLTGMVKVERSPGSFRCTSA